MALDEAYSPFHVNRRSAERVPVALPARIARGDGETFIAETACVSADGASFSSPCDLVEGEVVGALIGRIGLVRARVSRSVDDGFAISFDGAGRPERVAALIWLEQHLDGARRDLRTHERHLPPPATAAFAVPGEGRETTVHDVAVADLSFGGARLLTALRPAVGAAVRIGAMPARVVRHTDDGIALLFTGP